MSVGRKTAQYSAAAALVSIAIIAASFLYLGLPDLTQSSYQGPQSVLAIQLTDPPQVPAHTTSLNLTYSSLSLLVGEPTGTAGQFNTKSVTLTPSGGSATLDLLKLQNVSKTIATASLPTGSVIYSVTFTVTSIKIDVSKTISTVTLASGESSFTVTMTNPSVLSGTTVALLQLNPVVVNTPTGYQLIPSAVGVVRHSHGEGEDQVGSEQQLSSDDKKDLDGAKGSVTASILHLSVADDVTTLTVRVSNSGDVPVSLSAIGLQGNFSLFGNPVCTETNSGDVSTTTTTTQTSTTTANPAIGITQSGSTLTWHISGLTPSGSFTVAEITSQGFSANFNSYFANSTGADSADFLYGSGTPGDVITLTVTDTSSGKTASTSYTLQSSTTDQHCDVPDHNGQVVFVPVAPPTTTTSTSSTTTTTTTTATQTCSTGTMSLLSGNREDKHEDGLNLNPGQCTELTFTGKLSFGQFTIVPQTGTDQTFTLHIFASNGADKQQGCVKSHGHDNCDNHQGDDK